MKRLSCVRVFLVSIPLAGGLLLTGGIVLAFVSVSEVAAWPKDWPQELEPYREHALKWCCMGGEAEETLYYIKFRNRPEFENIWPTLLKLKSKGAPLHLCSAGVASADADSFAAFFEGPMVTIKCPTSGTYQLRADGFYSHVAQWTQDLAQSDGPLPEFVVRRKEDGIWAPVEQHAASIPAHCGVLERARVELLLFVDGKVIDLNRIRLPEDTPILDRRTFDPDGFPQNEKETGSGCEPAPRSSTSHSSIR